MVKFLLLLRKLLERVQFQYYFDVNNDALFLFASFQECRGSFPVVKCTYCRSEFQQTRSVSGAMPVPACCIYLVVNHLRKVVALNPGQSFVCADRTIIIELLLQLYLASFLFD